MAPDLGKYAVEVTMAYSFTLLILGGLIAVSLLRARKAKANLAAIEKENES